jgi:hypothetical protein
LGSHIEIFIRGQTTNRHGHAHPFAAETHDEKQIVEFSTVRDWVDAMRQSYGVVISDLAQIQQAGADFSARCGGRMISIELTELVNAELLREIARERRGYDPLSYDAKFRKSQWASEQFKSKIDERISAKEEFCARQELPRILDALVIHTDEDWLLSTQVREWL